MTGFELGRASLRGAMQRAELERQRVAIPDPAIGLDRGGVLPGSWGSGVMGEPLPGEMPPDCPVKVLGVNGDDLYVIDAMGQLTMVSDNQFGQGKVERLFGDRIGYVYWAWPRFARAKKDEPPRVEAFRTEKVRQALWGEAARKPLFNQLDRVRGRGVWPGPGGGLVVHCGDYIYVNGRMQYPGEIDDAIYPRMAPIIHPYDQKVDSAPALEVMQFLATCSWARPETDALLMLGWIGSALMSGALRKRPSIFIVGDKGWGKTTVQDYIRLIFGEYLLSTNDTTPAGIYQTVGHDARPVAIDELEAGAKIERVLRVTELARLGYDGAVMLRGGSDHNPVQFKSRSSFLMSAINPPPVPPAELSRMGVLSLVRPDKSRFGSPPVIREEDMIGAKIFKRLIDQWSNFEPLLAAYTTVLRAGSHDQRGQDTFGTLLACAHLLLGDEGLSLIGYPTADDLSPWAERLAAQSLPEYEDSAENWLGALGILMTKNLDIWRGGANLSVGSVLDALERNDMSFTQANNKLAQVTLKLLDRREVPGARGLVLAVPNSAPNMGKIFEGSTWGAGPSGHGAWASALRQAPAGVLIRTPDNRITINRVGFRCSLIDLGAYDEATGRRKHTKREASPDDF